MAVSASAIEKSLNQNLPDSTFKLIDLVGDQDHYSLIIYEPNLLKLTRINQHKAIFAALAEYRDQIHALTIKFVDSPEKIE